METVGRDNSYSRFCCTGEKRTGVIVTVGNGVNRTFFTLDYHRMFYTCDNDLVVRDAGEIESYSREGIGFNAQVEELGQKERQNI